MAHYVLVTGGRKPDEETVEHVVATIEFLHAFYGQALRVMHGAAPGVDTVAENTCQAIGVKSKGYPADWGRGKVAGLERNEKMGRLLDSWIGTQHTGEVIAFRGGTGTANMCAWADRLDLPLTYIPEVGAEEHVTTVQ